MFVIMKRFVGLFLMIWILGNAQILKSQSYESQISDKFFDYVENSRNEKLYVQSDRDSYMPGDTMFIRGFLFNAVSNRQVDYSRYIYVEVVDRTGVLYWREKIAYNTQDSKSEAKRS